MRTDLSVLSHLQVVDLLHCGRQKAVNTLRELQYAGLVEIQKQGLWKTQPHFPKNPMKRFQTPTSRNPVLVRRRAENRTYEVRNHSPEVRKPDGI